MKKNSLKILLLGAVGGFSCILFHSGSYGGTPIALYQHPLHILIFYLLFFVVQSGL